MVNIKISYILNIILGISLLVVLITGIIKLPLFDLYEHSRGGFISNVHDISGVIFSILAIIHLLLHLKWYIAITKNFLKKPKYIQVK
jgi:hypothetical protein